VARITILAAGNIGFINVQTLITQLMSYFRVITNPKAVFLTTESIEGNSIDDEDAKLDYEKWSMRLWRLHQNFIKNRLNQTQTKSNILNLI
jgi:hypothetical protein